MGSKTAAVARLSPIPPTTLNLAQNAKMINPAITSQQNLDKMATLSAKTTDNIET
jgi:hypothetical protein